MATSASPTTKHFSFQANWGKLEIKPNELWGQKEKKMRTL
jgi:hypothetical protein